MVIEPEKYFYLKNGGVLKNIEELRDYLKIISEDEFSFHVRFDTNKNDFACWVRDVFCQESLAQKMFDFKDKLKLISLLENYLQPRIIKKKPVKEIIHPEKIKEKKRVQKKTKCFDKKEARKVVIKHPIKQQPEQQPEQQPAQTGQQLAQIGQQPELQTHFFHELKKIVAKNKLLGRIFFGKPIFVEGQVELLNSELDKLKETVDKKL
ncbi:MAG: hypothetical protein ABIC91_02555 [Nanoarchaeota archaeon]|nr:hypothetical protein [Nanoarchaeota archaeon]MBU1030278.1 hypothetical protein [Nanoarchaeota archaeon]MBU1850059.1 hypothetical protein [Nanoarchaeota archaeon]